MMVSPNDRRSQSVLSKAKEGEKEAERGGGIGKAKGKNAKKDKLDSGLLIEGQKIQADQRIRVRRGRGGPGGRQERHQRRNSPAARPACNLSRPKSEKKKSGRRHPSKKHSL